MCPTGRHLGFQSYGRELQCPLFCRAHLEQVQVQAQFQLLRRSRTAKFLRRECCDDVGTFQAPLPRLREDCMIMWPRHLQTITSGPAGLLWLWSQAPATWTLKTRTRAPTSLSHIGHIWVSQHWGPSFAVTDDWVRLRRLCCRGQKSSTLILLRTRFERSSWLFAQCFPDRRRGSSSPTTTFKSCLEGTRENIQKLVSQDLPAKSLFRFWVGMKTTSVLYWTMSSISVSSRGPRNKFYRWEKILTTSIVQSSVRVGCRLS